MTNDQLQSALVQAVNRIRLLEAACTELQAVIENSLATKIMVNQLHVSQVTRLQALEERVSNLETQIASIQSMLAG